MSDRPGDLERFAFDKSVRAAWNTEFWVPDDPDFGFLKYFEAAISRNLGLLRGFEELADDVESRGIIPQTESDQAQLVTDGGVDRPGDEVSRTLVIAGCGAAKWDQPARAKDLYTSTYFQKKREFAEVVGDEWKILSAEHGLIDPLKPIVPYETSIDDLDDAALDELAHDVGTTLIEWATKVQSARGVTVEEIVVLGGRKYIDPLKEREAFHAGVEPTVTFPLQQHGFGGIGEQMAWLKERVEAESAEQAQLVTDGGVGPRCAAGVVFALVDDDLMTCGDCGQTVDVSGADTEMAVVATLAKHQQEVHDA